MTKPLLRQRSRSGGELLGALHVGDVQTATREAIAAALDADLVAISGGMSVGQHDHVRPALADLGASRSSGGSPCDRESRPGSAPIPAAR